MEKCGHRKKKEVGCNPSFFQMGANSSGPAGPLPSVPDGSLNTISRSTSGVVSRESQPTPTIQDVPTLNLPHFKEKVTLNDFEPIRTVYISPFLLLFIFFPITRSR